MNVQVRGIQMFKCPVCNRLHPINADAEDLNEALCTDNATSEIRQFRGIENPNAITMNGWNFNRSDSLRKAYVNDAPLRNLKFNRYTLPKRQIANWK